MSEVPEVPTFRLARRKPRPDPCLRDSLGPETHVTHDALGASCPVSLGYATDPSSTPWMPGALGTCARKVSFPPRH